MGTFNTYGSKQKKYGGSNPVWLSVSQKERSGGTLGMLPPMGAIIPAGSLVNIDEAGGNATIIETFLVTNITTETKNIITVRGYKQDSVPKNGMILMKAPYNMTSTIVHTQTNACEIVNVAYDSVKQEYTFDCGSYSFGEMKIGDILVRANKVGAGATMELLPTGITENDVYIDKGDTAATVASVFHGEIMEDRIQVIPACVKAALPMIKFQKGV